MSTDIHWPSFLPKPLRSNHSDRAQSSSISTRFGTVSRSRRIYSDAPSTVVMSWKFTAEELWFFRGFYTHRLDDGNLWFWCPMFVGGVLQEREVSFMGQELESVLQGVSHGLVTATVTTRRSTAMDATTWEAMEAAGGPAGYYEMMLAAALAVNTED